LRITMHKRREFLKLTAGAAAGAAFLAGSSIAEAQSVPDAIRQLKPMIDGIVPISDEERLDRIDKAKRLMVENGIRAIFLEPGTGSFYFTGMRTWISERMIALVIPAKGELAWVCPKFEEDRMRELIRFGKDIRTWEEDESPYKVVAGILAERGLRTGKVGIEERVRFFLFDGIRKEANGFEYVSADPVTAGCRMYKSPAELALMQRANDITIAAYKATVTTLHEGMTPAEFEGNCRSAFRALGVSGGIDANFGKYTASPHGSSLPERLAEGDVVMMDGGCSVEGYQSDITRTIVFGKPTQRQRDIWDLERKAQDAGFAAAKVGVACEDVDAAARNVIVDAGFGPGYKVPGLPHRTGHGIGLDGHEWTYLVRGNKTPIQPGMCFSDEPTISIPGEFGIRLEDCMYITEDGARFFTHQSPSIDEPFL
jgi:Xaa-Pro dipeptidase